MDFAIIETGGKQYKLIPGNMLSIERLAVEVGQTVTFDKVLMNVHGDVVEIGTPYLDGVKLEATIEAQTRGKKIRVLRFRAKSRHRRHIGHRQAITQVVLAGSKSLQTPKTTTVIEDEAHTSKSDKKPKLTTKTVKKTTTPTKLSDSKKTAKSAPKKTSEKTKTVKK